MNIKSAEAHELSRELAALTGETVTTAVTVAVRERLERVRDEHAATESATDRLLRLGRMIASRLPDGALDTEHGAVLYDERGLPR